MSLIKKEIVLKIISVDKPMISKHIFYSYMLIAMELDNYFVDSPRVSKNTTIATIPIDKYYIEHSEDMNEAEYAGKVIRYIISINDPEYLSSAKKIMDKIIKNKSFRIDNKKFNFTNEYRSDILVQYISKSYPSPDWKITPSK